MYNIFQKLHALFLSNKINIWHYPEAPKHGAKPYIYWIIGEDKEGHRYDNLEEMINAAYNHIDPLLQPLPPTLTPPEQAKPL